MEWSALWMLAPPLIMLIGISLWLGNARKQHMRLDSIWSWLGPGIDHRGSGRTWRGRLGQRPVEVTWFDRNTMVSLTARPRMRGTFRRAGAPFTASLSHEEVEVVLPGDVLGTGPDPVALRALESQPGVREALRLLLGTDEPGRPAIRSVSIGPARSVTYFTRNLKFQFVTEQQTRRWVEALLVIAQGAEHRAARTPERAQTREREAFSSPSMG